MSQLRGKPRGVWASARYGQHADRWNNATQTGRLPGGTGFVLTSAVKTVPLDDPFCVGGGVTVILDTLEWSMSWNLLPEDVCRRGDH